MKYFGMALTALALVLIGSQSASARNQLTPGQTNSGRIRRKVTTSNKSRACDSKGCGHYGASRVGHTHQGLDIEAFTGERIYAPINGYISRYANPYQNDSRYSGVEIIGSGIDQGKKVKIFYLTPTVLINTHVEIGTSIGKAQNIAAKFSAGMTNHVHIQYYINNNITNPNQLFNS